MYSHPRHALTTLPCTRVLAMSSHARQPPSCSPSSLILAMYPRGLSNSLRSVTRWLLPTTQLLPLSSSTQLVFLSSSFLTFNQTSFSLSFPQLVPQDLQHQPALCSFATDIKTSTSFRLTQCQATLTTLRTVASLARARAPSGSSTRRSMESCQAQSLMESF